MISPRASKLFVGSFALVIAVLLAFAGDVLLKPAWRTHRQVVELNRQVQSLVDELNSRKYAEEVNRAASSRLIDLGSRAAPGLLQALGEEDKITQRASIAFVLSKIELSTPDAVVVLTRALADRNSGVRLFAADALGRMGPLANEAAAGLIKCTGDPERNVREHSALALGAIGTGRAVHDLMAILDNQSETDEDVVLRRIAASSLGRIGAAAKEAVPALKRCLAEDDERLRLVAGEALKQIEGERF